MNEACAAWYGCLITAKQQDHLKELEVVLRSNIPPNEQDPSLLQSNTMDACINPAALDPEAMHCNCYKKLVKAGGCNQNASVVDQSKCLRCQICLYDQEGKWILCDRWKKAACQKEHLDDHCSYKGIANMVERGSVSATQEADQHDGQATLDESVQIKSC